jgi:excisionase family DNA binding protein
VWYTVHTMSLENDPFFERPRSIKEVALYLGATRVHIERQILAGKLRARKFSTRFIRIMPADLREWMDACSTKPFTAAPAGQQQEEREEVPA